MIECYDKMELTELAAQTRTMYRANYEGESGERRIAPKKKWWKPWAAKWGHSYFPLSANRNVPIYRR